MFINHIICKSMLYSTKKEFVGFQHSSDCNILCNSLGCVGLNWLLRTPLYQLLVYRVLNFHEPFCPWSIQNTPGSNATV